MTARYLMTLALVLGVGGFAAGCSGDDKTNPDVGDDDDAGDDDDVVGDDDDDTAPTGTPGGGGFNAEQIQVAGQFGYDAAASSPGAVDFGDGYPLGPTVDFYVATLSWQNDFQDTANYCFISFPLDNGNYSTLAAADARLWYGVEHNPSDAVISNCNEPGWELDPALWGADLVGDFAAASADIFVGVGDMSQTIEDDVLPQFPTEDQPYLLGGALGTPSYFLGGTVDDVYGFAYQTDANLVLADDGAGYLIPLASLDVNTGAGVATGWYRLSSYVYWTVSP